MEKHAFVCQDEVVCSPGDLQYPWSPWKSQMVIPIKIFSHHTAGCGDDALTFLPLVFMPG